MPRKEIKKKSAWLVVNSLKSAIVSGTYWKKKKPEKNCQSFVRVVKKYMTFFEISIFNLNYKYLIEAMGGVPVVEEVTCWTTAVFLSKKFRCWITSRRRKKKKKKKKEKDDFFHWSSAKGDRKCTKFKILFKHTSQSCIIPIQIYAMKFRKNKTETNYIVYNTQWPFRICSS